MKKIKIIAEHGVRFRGGQAACGEIIELDDHTADYFLDRGYAGYPEDPAPMEVNKAPIKKKAPAKKAWRKNKESE